RAVDRTVLDYARIVCLDDPMRLPLMDADDYKKFSQHEADLLSLKDNALTSRNVERVVTQDLRAPIGLFASVDRKTLDRLRELGYAVGQAPYIVDFAQLLQQTEFPKVMREMLAELSRVYDYP